MKHNKCKKHVNHYKWLDKYLPLIFKKLGINWDQYCGVVVAHGDKFYGYKPLFDELGIPFPHGAVLGILTYVYDYECRQTKNGWVSPEDWIRNNYMKYIGLFPAIDESDEDVLSF